MEPVRPPAVAGAFYPADTATLRGMVEGLLDAAAVPEIDVDPAMAIVPHAGYVYSGPIAATAYRLIHELVPRPERVVVVGPSHFVRFDGIATPGAESMQTPLGLVPVDEGLRAAAEDHPVVLPDTTAHGREHSLEVQLPFLQAVLGSFGCLPLATGGVAAGVVADVLDVLLGERGVFGIVSSDLSHYLDYAMARARDEATAGAIVDLRIDDIGGGDACGRTAVQAALVVAQRRGWGCRLLDLRNSGDTAGDQRSVVGYGAFVLGPAAV